MKWIAILILTLPLPAAAFTAQNGMEAVRTSPTDITVAYDPGREGTDYWCAAGDFVQRGLNLMGNTKLWQASPDTRPSGAGMVFTLSETRKHPDAGLSHFGSGPDDGSITAGMAAGSFCHVRRFYDD